jgi:hypothetical protein
MLWLIPFLLFLIFLLFRFVKTHQESTTSIPLPSSSFVPWWDTYTDAQPQIDEGFISLQTSNEFKEKYNAFVSFHTGFMTRWKDALVTAFQLQKEPGKADSTIPPDATLNTVVTKWISEQGKPFPFLTNPLPATVNTLDDLERIQEQIPKDSQPYFNALEWMNQQLIKAQKEVESAMSGNIPSFEGFQGTCSEIAKCFRDNPDLARQLLNAQQADAAQRLEQLQRDLISRFEQFQQPRIKNAYELNTRLTLKAKEIQDKAQSGDWVKDLKMGGKDGSSYALPPGSNDLAELCKKDRVACEKLKREGGSMFALKQLFEQINRNLR